MNSLKGIHGHNFLSKQAIMPEKIVTIGHDLKLRVGLLNYLQEKKTISIDKYNELKQVPKLISMVQNNSFWWVYIYISRIIFQKE